MMILSNIVLTVGALVCEYLVDPVGIDVVKPRLSWVVRSSERGQGQSAYRVLIASSASALNADDGDLWDSGKVESDRTTHIVYEGAPLTSGLRCYWKVMAWDRDGRPSAWSEPSTWSMGLLAASDWQAQWIGHTPSAPSAGAGTKGEADDNERLNFDDCEWIWHPHIEQRYPGDDRATVEPCTRYFRRTFDLPASAAVRWAGAIFTADDAFELHVNGQRVGGRTSKGDMAEPAYMAEVTQLLAPGKNVIAVEASKLAVGLAGVVGKLVIELENGEEMTVMTDGSCGYWYTKGVIGEHYPSTWKSSKEDTPGPAGWTQADFNDEQWEQAQPITSVDHGFGRALPGSRQTHPSPMLRKTFELHKPIKSAAVHVSGLGYYELRLNGDKVGDHVLDPLHTRYDKRVLYVTYDVTDRLRRGGNALGVMLGNGWYNMHARTYWDMDAQPWRDRPKLLLQLHVVYEDGSSRVITSDDTWRGSAGPIVLDNLYHGEVYDARREIPGWDEPDYDDSAWSLVDVVAAPPGALRAQMAPPIRVTQTVTPVAVSEPKPGVFVFDMGQNFAGWAQLKVSGAPGTKLTMLFGERMAPDGTVQQTPVNSCVLQGPFQRNTYLLRGKGEETWEPRFTYHGFQYVQVTGFPGRPTADNLSGRVVHTDFDSAGSFECSNDLLNRVQQMTLWSYRSNFHGYPTDDPHREKHGWTGDAMVIAETALWNYRNAAAYEKWMNDIADAQLDSGKLPSIVPPMPWAYDRDAGPLWDAAYILIPWHLYQYYGDTRVLAEHYDGFERYVKYLTSRAQGNIVSHGSGDWCPAKTSTPIPVTSTAYYYVITQTVSKIAQALDKTDDAQQYAELAERIRQSFNETFYQGGGVYSNASQAALSGALDLGLAQPQERARVLEQLLANIEQADWHMDVGFFGTQWLPRALTANGRIDVAYRITTQTTPPSYGDWIKRGATTIWEDWHANASLNHFAFGSISAWFYEALAGINRDPQSPGFKHFVIRPRPVGDLTWAKAHHDSMHGRIVSAWRIDDGEFKLDVTVPTNTTAMVYVPAGSVIDVLEGDIPVAKAPAVKFIHMQDGCAAFIVESGQYQFTSK